MIFDGCVKVRESSYTQLIIWVNTILDHIDAQLILPMYEGSCIMCVCVCVDLNGIEDKSILALLVSRNVEFLS